MEQKNGAVVRHTVGYRRYEGLEAAAALAELYRSLRLFVNFFQPSFKLAEKSRDGAKVTKRYHPPATPHQRLVSDPRTTAATLDRVAAIYATLDPVQLLSAIRSGQQRLVEIADRPVSSERLAPTAPTLEAFLSGLRTAWRDGEVRPTSRPKEKAKRGRRRPDPLVAVTAQLNGWFEAEPWWTARELLERLQDEQPGSYPTGLLRTVQRRLKVWRRDKMEAAGFLRDLVEVVPYTIHTVLTDNGVQFTSRARDIHDSQHIFDRVCDEHGIAHRLTKVNHPWTNGQVKRMNRTLKDATVKRYHYESHDELRAHLKLFLDAYNYARRLKALRGITSYEFICRAWTQEPERFRLDPSHHTPGLNT